MSWRIETFGSLLTESRIPCENPDIEKRIRVKLNVQGVEKRPVGVEKEGATNQFIRKSGQFIYGKQNFHKGAFGVIPPELDGFETSADIPSFDVREDCLPEWIYYFFKSGNRYLELTEYARGVGSQRIHPKQLVELEIPLPPLEVQYKIIEELKIFEKDEISAELTHQLDLVKQLRQAFLREAMQGKIVPQDPNDEPASDLLKKIKAEKEQLIKQGKIKKQKNLPPISEDEIPFEIPENWAWCRLGDISINRLGKMLDGAKNKGKELPYLRNLNVQWYSFNLEDVKLMKFEDSELEEYSVKKGDLLIVEGGEPGRCAIWEIDDESFKFQKAIHRVRFLGELHTWIYQYYFDFLNKSTMISEYFTGAGIKHLTGKSLNKVLLPLPPLSEQQRIVAKLDELMTYCDELEASIKESQQQNEMLLQQVLREALEPKLN